jgi:photosystem II stability/assembly factor-like uncharacterized protein
MNKNCSAFFTMCILFSFGGTQSHAQWLQQTSGTTAKLTDIVMLDSTTAIAVGYNGTILKTTNAGGSWIPKITSGPDWNALSFANATQGVAVGNNGGFGMTTNGGETWVTSTQGGGNLLSVAYVNSATILFGSDSGSIFRTTNGGVSWSRAFLDNGPIKDIFFTPTIAPTYSLYGITPITAYKSTDTGSSWTPQSLPFILWVWGASATRGCFTAGGSTAFIVGYDGQLAEIPVILRRRQSDTSWQRYAFPPSSPVRPLFDVSTPTSEVAYACGYPGVIFKTTDGGDSWQLSNNSPLRRLNGIHFFNAQRGLVVGDSGTILFTSNGATFVRENEDAPSEVKLFQNYPNPFNATTKITFVLPLFSQDPARLREGLLVSLKIYDALGREVATLVDERLTPRIYERTFSAEGGSASGGDAMGFASGVYIYRLATPFGSRSRKLLLLK